jgi:hypothetical protein
MNEPSSLTTSQVTLSNGAAFTSAGGLYMPVIGHQAVFEMPEYTIGHTAFANAVGVMAGATIGNYLIEFSIDKNDGSGFSAYQTATGVNLSGVTGINAQLGFKLRVRVTTSTTNATAITSLYFTTVSTTTAQDYLYPLDVATVEIGGLVTDSRVVAKKVSDGTVLFNGVEVAGSVLFTTDFIGAVRIIARKASAAPYYIEWETQITTIAGSMVSAIALQQSE